eukprot:2265170-Amphidinium_carterae.1
MVVDMRALFGVTYAVSRSCEEKLSAIQAAIVYAVMRECSIFHVYGSDSMPSWPKGACVSDLYGLQNKEGAKWKWISRDDPPGVRPVIPVILIWTW